MLFGNLAPDGCVVKTAGVGEDNLVFSGPARVFESQEDAVSGILGGAVQAGDVVVIRYEVPRAAPGMQEMLHPTSFLKGRWPRPGLCVGHRRPVFRWHVGPVHRARFAGGGRGRVIGLVVDGDLVELDIPERKISLRVSDEELAARRVAEEKRDRPFTPRDRRRPVTAALRAYASMATAASDGAYRVVD